MRSTRYILMCALLALFALACTDDTQQANNTSNNTTNNDPADMSGDVSPGPTDMSGGDTSSPPSDMPGGSDASPPGDMDVLADLPFMVNDMGQVLCGDAPCACADGMDNDGDGLIDGFDPECTGPYDNDEATFATGISGDNKDPMWQDCFFDGNSGSGDDKCRYHTDCLTGDAAPDDRRCQISDECRNNCQKFAPNGCDCFGCCTLFKPDGTSKSVVIGTECSLARIDDTSVCQECVPTTECGNACGECELCPGRSPEDLPESCRPTPTPDMGMMDMGSQDMGNPPDDPGYTCDGGAEICSLTDPCQEGYCLQGCCTDIPQ